MNTVAGGFEPYGPSHQAVLVLLLLVAAILVSFARSRPSSRASERLGKTLALAILLLTLPLQAAYLTPAYWSLRRTLPLDLCDLAWMVAVVALWTHRRWAVALTYYWGLTLSTQAVLTPDLAQDFPDPAFLLFWGTHLLIVWSAVYLTWGLRLTPDWRCYRTAVALTGAWAVTALAVDQVAGTNYGYLRAKPATGSVLDLLGPWPWYVLAEVAVVALVWALVTWPWVVLSHRRATPSPAAAAGGPPP